MIDDKFQLLLEHSSDAIAEFDASLRYQSANTVEASLLGHHPQDLIGKTHAELLSELADSHPLRSAMGTMDACLRQVVEQARALTVTYELATSAGLQCYETVYTPVVTGQHVSRVFSVGRQRWAQHIDPQTSNGNGASAVDQNLSWTPEAQSLDLVGDRPAMEIDAPEAPSRQPQPLADGRIAWRKSSQLLTRDESGQGTGLLGTSDSLTQQRLVEDLLSRSESKYRELAQREELLNRLATQIRQSLDLTTLLQTVVREVRHLLDTDRVVVYQFGEDWQGRVVFEDVIPPWISTLGEMGADNCFPGKFAQLYQQGRVRAIHDVANAGLDECHTQFLLSLDVKANLIVPILIYDQLWGLLVAHECRGSRVWKQSETDLLYHLAGHIGIGIQQAELYAQATQNARVAQAQAKELEQALRNLQEAQAQLIQTEKMSSLGQLVAGIAHEINNPVNFIYGNINYIDEYVHDLTDLIKLYRQHDSNPSTEIQEKVNQLDLEFLLEDITKILKSLKVGSERIRQLVLSLRNFSRVDEAAMKQVDIHDGIDNTLLILSNHFKPQPQHSAIRVVKQYGSIPPVECYPGQLNQVLMNILSNAVDALNESSSRIMGAQREQADRANARPTITIATELAANQEHVIIRICDNGVGIPPEVQTRLFDPFFTTKPVGKGTGLGLSISQHIIVEKHGGSLTCLSAPHQGAEFRIEIPIRHRYE